MFWSAQNGFLRSLGLYAAVNLIALLLKIFNNSGFLMGKLYALK